jgi:GAF domain-containing protein
MSVDDLVCGIGRGIVRPMPMRATTIRFPDSIWQLLEDEAQQEGVSAAQFIRDATILRIGAVMAQRGDRAALAGLQELAVEEAGESPRGASRPDPTQTVVRDRDRLAALHASGALESSSREALDRIAQMAAGVLNVPVALVSLVDADQQVFGGCVGVAEPWATDRRTPLSHSFCQHAVASREPLVVTDAREHPVLRDNAAIRDLGVIAYAGVPLIDADGYALGTLCVIDHKPRTWSRQELRVLEDLSASAMSEIALEATRRQLARLGELRSA